MSNLGEQAMEILDELHKERLAYESEYVPLADAANLLTAYEQTGMDPEAIDRMADAYGRGLTLREDAAERLEIIRGLSTARLRELADADRNNEFQRHLKRFDIMQSKKQRDIEKMDKEAIQRWLTRSLMTNGISEDRLRELCYAERDGRCVVFQPGPAVVSHYYQEDGLYIREAAGLVSKEEYEQAAREGGQDV